MNLENKFSKKIHKGTIYDIDFNEEKEYATASKDNTIQIWNLDGINH